MGNQGFCGTDPRDKLKTNLEAITGMDCNIGEENLDHMLHLLGGDPDILTKYSKPDENQEKKQCQIQFEGSAENEFQNWGGNVKHTYKGIYYPKSVRHVQDIVRKAKSQNRSVRGSGIRHSWSEIFADDDNYLVCFYPEEVATGKFRDLTQYVNQIQAENPEYKSDLYDIEIVPRNKSLAHSKIVEEEKKLVKIGAGVSNQQLRRWCKKNDLEYEANVIMVQVNFCGALAACCHGSGVRTTPIPDFVHSIQFINCKGELQQISKDQHPDLIKSAASNMGLLGLIVFVTIQMRPQRSAIFRPRKGPGDEIIPRPGTRSDKFQYECMMSYAEWFYFTAQQNTYANVFEAVPKTSGEENAEFPPPLLTKLSAAMLNVANFLENTPKGEKLSKLFELWTGKQLNLFRVPYIFFPGNIFPLGERPVKVDFMDAIHFQRGIQNFPCRDFQVEINIPKICDGMDFELIQKAWWGAMDYVKEHEDVIDMVLQMRLFKGSECPLAPYYKYEYVCAIQVLRTLTNNRNDDKWIEVVEGLWKIWNNLTDHEGNKATVRVHWAKEWTGIPKVKEAVLNDQSLKDNFKEFQEDYSKIGAIGGWKSDEGLEMFSNETYNKLLDRK